MSYETLLEQIKAAPEECLDEISNYVNYVIYRYEKQNEKPTSQLESAMLEALQISGDPSVKGFTSTKELF